MYKLHIRYPTESSPRSRKYKITEAENCTKEELILQVLAVWIVLVKYYSLVNRVIAVHYFDLQR